MKPHEAGQPAAVAGVDWPARALAVSSQPHEAHLPAAAVGVDWLAIETAAAPHPHEVHAAAVVAGVDWPVPALPVAAAPHEAGPFPIGLADEWTIQPYRDGSRTHNRLVLDAGASAWRGRKRYLRVHEGFSGLVISESYTGRLTTHSTVDEAKAHLVAIFPL